MCQRRVAIPALCVVVLTLAGCDRSSERATLGETLGAVEAVDGPTGIVVLAPPGAERRRWDLWRPGNDRPVSQAHELDTLVPIAPGRYTVTEYFNKEFVWAQLAIEAGQTTRVRLGAIRVLTPTRAEAGRWDLWDGTGQAKLDEANENERVIPVPAGTFTVKEYFNPHFVWARDLDVQPGAITELQLGAIQVLAASGSDVSRWDLLQDGGVTRIDEANGVGLAIPAPPGRYVVKRYLSDEILASGVTVVAGDVTTVQR